MRQTNIKAPTANANRSKGSAVNLDEIEGNMISENNIKIPVESMISVLDNSAFFC